MRKNILAALLIVGWIILSGIDFDQIPGQAALSTVSPQDFTVSKFSGLGIFADTIVESANFEQCISHLDTGLDFEKHFQRHKLYHVFLI
jgi:hypothetical protein